MTTYRQRLDAGTYKQDAPSPGGNFVSKHTTGGGPGDYGYQCPDCQRTFTTDHALKIHRTKTHGGEA